MRIKKLFLTFISLFTALSAVSCNNTQTEEPNKEYTEMNETFYNPLAIEKGLGDPWLTKHEDYYYFTYSQGTKITVTRSKQMTQLTENLEDENITKVILRQKQILGGNIVQIWAPEIFFFNDSWYIYFTAAVDEGDTLQLDTSRRTYGMKSKTTDAFGEWEAPVEIKLPCDYRSIDATFLNYNGKQYIVWAGWPNKENKQYWQDLYITELETNNPLKAKYPNNPAERHLISSPEHKWEITSARQNEGPAVGYAPDGTPIIFYSGNYSGDDSYCIVYLSLTGDDVTNKDHWYKPEQPLMQTDMGYSEVIAPGHCSITYSPDGKEHWMMYHSAKRSASGWDRMARLQKLEWGSTTYNGKTVTIPVVEKMFKIAEEVPLPSGEKVNRAKYEAENAVLTEDCYILDKEGYASNDKCVSIENGGNITFNVNIPENGTYVVQVRFSNRDSLETKLKVTVNGDTTELFAPNTQYDDSFSMTSFYTDLYIKREGPNTIKIEADAAIFIDCIIIDYLDHK